MLNYESELRDVLEEALSDTYGVKREVVFAYFHLRFLIEYGKVEKESLTKELVDFLLKELRLPSGDFFLYKGERIYRGFRVENSMRNIVEDCHFTASLKQIENSKGIKSTYEEYIEKEYKRLFRYGKNKAKPYSRYLHYDSYLKWNALGLLNKQYQATPRHAKLIEGVTYPTDDEVSVRTLEELHYANIHATSFLSQDVANITEQDLEKYLIKNLFLIEEGLCYLDKQVAIKDGRIDILARDKEGRYVIIELKVQEDKELIWQTLYYPMQFKKEHQAKEVRMLTLCPSYPPHILETLKEVKGVEMVMYTPTIELGKLKHIQAKKVS